jgi:glycosyltransferase involved in cell wall biosynthesis
MSSPAGVAASAKRSRPRVLHFVTGGFSGGATQVAIALVKAAHADGQVEALLVLRRKWRTPPNRIEELRAAGVPLEVVPGYSRIATVLALARVCRRFRPDVLVAHGFTEHLWGRYAGLLAGVPYLVQVEHNTRERYNWFHNAQSRWLSRRSAAMVGCSEGVRQVLLAQGLPGNRVIAISNGIDLQPFANADSHPWSAREPGIVMVARYSRQKDHATLLRAVAMLRDHRPIVYLAGGGKARHRQPVEALASALGIADRVRFLGVYREVPALLMRNRVAVLSTRWEGMPLALIEGMAAGCAVVATAVPGVRELIVDGVDGRLVGSDDPEAMAAALDQLLSDNGPGSDLAKAARTRAVAEFSRERMHHRYQRLCAALVGGEGIPDDL